MDESVRDGRSGREGVPDRAQAFRWGDRLHRRSEFQRCYRSGGKRHGRFTVLHVHPNEVSTPRLGITASRKVGGSVVRQRIKRRIREIFRRWPSRASLPAVDIVVHVKPQASEATFSSLARELERQLGSLLRADARHPEASR